MSRRILKFPLFSAEVGPFQDPIATADEPRFLSVGFQGDTLVVWAEATPGSEVTTKLAIVPTGGDAPRATYIGTAMHPTLNGGGPFVVHVYRVHDPLP